MNPSLPPLLLKRAEPPPDEDRWRGTALRWLGAALLHLAPCMLLMSAVPHKPQIMGGAFGESVSITLVSGGPKSAQTAPEARPNLSSLERRLSQRGVTVAEPSTAAPLSSTRLSDLLDHKTAGHGPEGPASNSQKQLSTPGTDDDPFARASVSYRGDDQARPHDCRPKHRNASAAASAFAF